MTDNEQEQIYSIALTMVPGIGHIGAKRLVEGMKSATDVFRFRKELAQRLSGVHERVSGVLRFSESASRIALSLALACSTISAACLLASAAICFA